jgi:hypothetical protein
MRIYATSFESVKAGETITKIFSMFPGPTDHIHLHIDLLSHRKELQWIPRGHCDRQCLVKHRNNLSFHKTISLCQE